MSGTGGGGIVFVMLLGRVSEGVFFLYFVLCCERKSVVSFHVLVRWKYDICDLEVFSTCVVGHPHSTLGGSPVLTFFCLRLEHTTGEVTHTNE